MQFTGLQDRTGKDIYEGDILQYYDQKGYRMGTRINIVKWQNTKSATGFNIAVTRRCEVIGNIYENQDLLWLIQTVTTMIFRLSCKKF